MDSSVEGSGCDEFYSDSILDYEETDIFVKFAAAKAFPSVVGILSSDNDEDAVYWGNGIVIECDKQINNYVSNVVCPANLFHTGSKVEVYLWYGQICRGRVTACDRHYNLAVVSMESHSSLPIASLRELDDVVSIRPPSSFLGQQSTDTSLFKVTPETKLISISRLQFPSQKLVAGSGVFRATSSDDKLNCNELYWVEHINWMERCGGAVLNYLGDVIGLMFYGSPFLPCNVISRWWKHYKTHGFFCRPWLGLGVANAHSCGCDYLSKLGRKFPHVDAAVVVTEMLLPPPIILSEHRLGDKDIILKCNGHPINSILKLFDSVWGKVGDTVELEVLRWRYGDTQTFRVSVQSAEHGFFYRWEPQNSLRS